MLPIVEPAKSEWRNIEGALNLGLRLAVVVNPNVGIYSPVGARARRVQQPMPAVSELIFLHANTIPTFIISENTTAAMVVQFGRRFQQSKMFIVEAAPRRPNADPIAAAASLNPTYFAIRRRAVAVPSPRANSVDLVDNFTRQETNSLYPFDEFYTDRHLSILVDRTSGHFGDYSIVGDQYREGGGRAKNVALHHVYMSGPKPADLRIRHYVSAAHPDVTTMWLDAIAQLVTDLPTLARMSPDNRTSVLAEYRSLQRTGAFPGLGKMKELALRHHLLLMTAV